MAVKSIIDVEVKDGPFKEFHRLFDDYQAKLGLTPGQWGEANVAIAAVGAAFAAQTEVLARLAQKQRDYTQEVRHSALAWSDVASSSRRVYDNILATTTSLLRLTGAGAIFSGLLGAGGLFGIDLLARGVGNTRRTAQGLGATYGEQKAFGSTFGTYFTGTDQLVQGIAQALTDPSKAYALTGPGAGAKQEDIQSGDAVRIAASILPNLQNLAKNTSLQLLQPTLNSLALQDMVPMELFRQLRSSDSGKLGELEGLFHTRAADYEVGGDTATKFQDFLNKLDAAGEKIESILVSGLAPLAEPLAGLATALAGDVAAVLKNPAFAEWIDEVGASLNQAATYLGSPEFIQQLKDFTDSFGFVAEKVLSWAKALGFVASNAGAIGTGASLGALLGGRPGAVVGAGLGALAGASNDALKDQIGSDIEKYGYSIDPYSGQIVRGSSGRNNPGNLRIPGTDRLQSFATPELGVKAIADQLHRYEFGAEWQSKHLNTVASIMATYDPRSENDTAAIIRSVSKQTGFDPNQRLDLNDQATMANLVAAITRQEGTNQQYSPGQVVTILNNSGGNVILQTSQAAPPQ